MMKTTKEKSIKQEKRLAKKFNLKQVPASGAVRFGGYDFKSETETHIIESKSTDKDFFDLKNQDLMKLYRRSGTGSKDPVFIIEFYSGEIYCLQPTFDEPNLVIDNKGFRISNTTIKKELASGTNLVLQFKKEKIRWKITNKPEQIFLNNSLNK